MSSQTYSLRQFLFFWVVIFVVSVSAFLYVLFHSFFASYLNESSFKDLKHQTYLFQKKIRKWEQDLQDSIVTHGSTSKLLQALGQRDQHAVMQLIQNWRTLGNFKVIEVYDLHKNLVSSTGKDIQNKSFSLERDTNKVRLSKQGLLFQFSRTLYHGNSGAVVGFLVEEKEFDNLSFEDKSTKSIWLYKRKKFFSDFKSAKVAQSVIQTKLEQPFQIETQEGSFDGLKIQVAKNIEVAVLKKNLKTGAWSFFLQKYLLYFVICTLVLLTLFYLSYYRQIFIPLRHMSQLVSEKTLPQEKKSFLISEIQSIHHQIYDKISNLSASAQKANESKQKNINSLVANVAHELNNALVPLSGNLEFLKIELEQENLKEKKDIFDAISSLEHSYQRIKKIVSDLKVFSSESKIDTKPTNLVGLLELIKKDHTLLEIKNECSLKQKVCVDQERALQILTNLIKNAKQAYTQNQTSRVQLSAYPLESDFIAIDVLDWAGGISSQVKPYIFEPFFTTKKNQQGMGIGLALSKDLGQKMGGDLYLKESSALGTTFCFKIRKSV